jgi:hypothetical protein
MLLLSLFFLVSLLLLASLLLLTSLPLLASLLLLRSLLRWHPFCSKIIIELLAFQLSVGIPAVVVVPAVAGVV